jgi:hypothetical protein
MPFGASLLSATATLSCKVRAGFVRSTGTASMLQLNPATFAHFFMAPVPAGAAPVGDV